MDFILLGFVFVHTYIITEEMSLWLTILLHNYTDLIYYRLNVINNFLYVIINKNSVFSTANMVKFIWYSTNVHERQDYHGKHTHL